MNKNKLPIYVLPLLSVFSSNVAFSNDFSPKIDLTEIEEHVRDLHFRKNLKDLKKRCVTDPKVGEYSTSFYSGKAARSAIKNAVNNLPKRMLKREISVKEWKGDSGYGADCKGKNKGKKVKCKSITSFFGPASKALIKEGYTGKLITSFPTNCVLNDKRKKKKPPQKPKAAPVPLPRGIFPPIIFDPLLPQIGPPTGIEKEAKSSLNYANIKKTYHLGIG